MKIQSKYAQRLTRKSFQGQTLIIVLAFLLLLTVLSVTFLSRSILDKQFSNASSNQSKVDLTSQGAIATIISDLQGEIVAGSATPTTPGVYIPNTNTVMIPAISGFTTATGLENLLKISKSGKPFYAGASYNTAATARAATSPTTTPSLNSRSVSLARWTKPSLIDTTTATMPTPDWIYVARDGTNPTAWDIAYKFDPTVTPTTATALGTQGNNPVTQRFAYAIYDEGSTLDMNVAGSPVDNTAKALSTIAPYKYALAYADLTQLPGISTLAAADQAAVINAIVGWRNNASAQATGNFPGYTGFGTATAPSILTPFDLAIYGNTSGFLRTGNTSLSNGMSDQAFVSRQQLIQLLASIGKTVTNFDTAHQQQALTAMGTFSRDINQPSYTPNSNRPLIVAALNGGNNAVGGDLTINPSFLATYVTTPFTRNNGSTALAKEPLVLQRFALNRLAWLTYQGPSASRNLSPAATVFNGSSGFDYDIWLLENKYGITSSYLGQGTASTIYKYFGLSWVQDNRSNGDGSSKWLYNHNNANATGPFNSVPAAGTGTPIKTLAQVLAAGREPDFVELLKSTICVGSIGKVNNSTGSLLTVAGYQNQSDVSVDAQIIQIAANIIDQFDTDGFPTNILFDDGTTFPVVQEYHGIEDLPYVSGFMPAAIRVQDATPSLTSGTILGQIYDITNLIYPVPIDETSSNPGLGICLEIPQIWNPHAWNTAAANNAPRPINFQLVAVNANPTNLVPLSPDSNAITAQATARYTATTTAALSTKPQTNVSLTPTNTELDFTIPINRLDLFREPTLLCKPNVPVGSTLQAGAGNYLKKLKVNNSALNPYTITVDSTTGALTGLDAWVYSKVGMTDTKQYLGIYLGAFPLRFNSTDDPPTPTSSGVVLLPNTPTVHTTAYVTLSGGNSLTFKLEYQNPVSSTWTIYDSKFTNLVNTVNNSNTNVATNITLSGPIMQNSTRIFIDPRTSRFGAFNSASIYTSQAWYNWIPDPRGITGAYTSYGQAGWAGNATGAYNSSYLYAAQQNATWTARPDVNSGFISADPVLTLGWYKSNPSGTFRPGVLTQNNPFAGNSKNRFNPPNYAYNGGEPGTSGAQYYADPDGVVRRAMGAYLQPDLATPLPAASPVASAPTGNPLSVSTVYNNAGVATPLTSEQPSRPIILNRPFRSPAELGYVFTGTPWRNLDFFTPESGDNALLDVFTIQDTQTSPSNLVAGKVNLNTKQIPALQAILAGAYTDEFNPTTSYLPITGTVNANTLATAFTTRTSDFINTAQGSGPMINIAEIVGKFINKSTIAGASPVAYNGGLTYAGFSGMTASGSTPSASPTNLSSILSSDSSASGYTLANIQRYRESLVRALSATTTTRMWNLMIDLVIQTGRYPTTVASFDNFNVEGEKRYWVHIAIDRFTGKVIDIQIEAVKE